MNIARKIRVLIVDDSAIFCKLLAGVLSGDPEIEVVGTAPDPYVARDKILALSPDVITLDIEMPRMDGLTFLRKLMVFRPMPVIVISSLGRASCHAAVEALRAGAVGVIAKPASPASVVELKTSLAANIRAAAAARVIAPSDPKPSDVPTRPPIFPPNADGHQFSPRALIAIGAPTGGTEAIEAVLTHLPPDTPGIVVTQHIPAGFSRAFAERLDRFCPMRVAEAVDGDLVRPGLALIAPGNFHMVVRESACGLGIAVKDGPLVCYQRPSVDVLFNSVAEAAGANAIGVILTGMGSDGAEGLKKMKAAGAVTIAQDQATCVVFGMPGQAIRLGAVDRVVPLHSVAPAIRSALHSSTAAAVTRL